MLKIVAFDLKIIHLSLQFLWIDSLYYVVQQLQVLVILVNGMRIKLIFFTNGNM